jgi:hypothetical protein
MRFSPRGYPQFWGADEFSSKLCDARHIREAEAGLHVAWADPKGSVLRDCPRFRLPGAFFFILRCRALRCPMR